MNSMVTSQATISALHVYPIKSCRGLDLASATLTTAGLRGDRCWMLVDVQQRFVTQRELPRMALITPEFHGEGLQVTAPDMPLLSIAGNSDSSTSVSVWKDQCAAFDEGDAAAEWFSSFLGREVRLVRFDEAQQRLSSPDWTGGVAAENQFSDGFPLLVIAQASLDDLNARLSAPLPMNRFRPNIVLSGIPAYAEDRIHELSDGDITLRLVKPCTRCKITTTDQALGVSVDREPLATLMTYRRDPQLRGVTFGQNAILCHGVGQSVRVGQSLVVHYKA